MNVKIYSKSEKKEEDVYLKLEKASSGVNLVAVNKDGERLSKGYIVRVGDDGELYIYSNTNREIIKKITYPHKDRVDICWRRRNL